MSYSIDWYDSDSPTYKINNPYVVSRCVSALSWLGNCCQPEWEEISDADKRKDPKGSPLRYMLLVSIVSDHCRFTASY